MYIYQNDKNLKILKKHSFFSSTGSLLELSCLERCLEPNITYSLSSLNYSFVTFLQPVKDTQSTVGLFLHHSSFQNFTRICQEIISEFKTCFLCSVCESKGNMDFVSQEQTSKGKYKVKVRIKCTNCKLTYSAKKKKQTTLH